MHKRTATLSANKHSLSANTVPSSVQSTGSNWRFDTLALLLSSPA